MSTSGEQASLLVIKVELLELVIGTAGLCCHPVHNRFAMLLHCVDGGCVSILPEVLEEQLGGAICSLLLYLRKEQKGELAVL